jgi:hypothetical protein
VKVKGEAEILGRGGKTEEWKGKKGKFKDGKRGTENLNMNKRAERGNGEEEKLKGSPPCKRTVRPLGLFGLLLVI